MQTHLDNRSCHFMVVFTFVAFWLVLTFQLVTLGLASLFVDYLLNLFRSKAADEVCLWLMKSTFRKNCVAR